MMVQLSETGGVFSVATMFRLKPKLFGSTQHTPIYYQNHIFGVREFPDDQLVCLDTTGKVVWTSPPDRRFRGGPFLLAQGMLFVLSEDGFLTLVEARTVGYKELARAKALQGPFACGPMALADGRLIVRDFNQMICLDVGIH
jgi:outer membrane protein assembly factor BamB